MRIISCYIENFGKLQKKSFTFTEGWNIFQEENGWGKSTLATFLKVMFYGFQNEKKRSELENERKRYQPWQGGVYGGTVTFEVKGVTYRIERSFDEKRKDRFHLIDCRTNLESQDFSERIGEELFELDGDSFLHTIFVAQQSCGTQMTSNIRAKIGNVSQNLFDMGNYDQVQERLKNKRNEWSPTRKTGRIYKKREEVALLESQLQRKDSIVERMRTIRQTLFEEEKKKELDLQKTRELLENHRKERLKRIDEWMQELSCIEGEALCRKEPKQQSPFMEKWEKRLAGKEDALEQAEILSVDWNRCLNQKQGMLLKEQQLKEKKREMTKKDFFFSGMLIGSVLVAIASLLLREKSFGIYLLLCIPCFLICGILHLGKAKRQLQRKKKEYQNLRQEYENEKFFYQETERKIRGFMRELQLGEAYEEEFQEILYEVKKDLEAYEREKDSQQMTREEQVSYEKRKEALKERIRREEADLTEQKFLVETTQDIERSKRCQRLQQELSSLEESLEELEARSHELAEAKQELKEAEEQYEILELTQEYLEAAKEQFSAKYMNPIQNRFSYYYKKFAKRDDREFEIDANFNLRVKELGRGHDTDFLSEGYQDLVGLCKRIAYVEAMYQKELPFLIFDDPFTNLDEEKIQGAFAFLQELSEKYQLIYFTCHQSRVPPNRQKSRGSIEKAG